MISQRFGLEIPERKVGKYSCKLQLIKNFAVIVASHLKPPLANEYTRFFHLGW